MWTNDNLKLFQIPATIIIISNTCLLFASQMYSRLNIFEYILFQVLIYQILDTQYHDVDKFIVDTSWTSGQREHIHQTPEDQTYCESEICRPRQIQCAVPNLLFYHFLTQEFQTGSDQRPHLLWRWQPISAYGNVYNLPQPLCQLNNLEITFM